MESNLELKILNILLNNLNNEKTPNFLLEKKYLKYNTSINEILYLNILNKKAYVVCYNLYEIDNNPKPIAEDGKNIKPPIFISNKEFKDSNFIFIKSIIDYGSQETSNKKININYIVKSFKKQSLKYIKRWNLE